MFQFKQFSVSDMQSTMKVGTDAVLLGTWVETTSGAKNILEIGTGCGVISLILAQRMPACCITAVDIDEDSAKEASANFQKSPFTKQLKAHAVSIQEYAKSSPEKFNLIVSNPPFFQNSPQAKSDKKTLARHSNALSFEELLHYTRHLLLPDGKFCCILPFLEARRFSFEAEMNSLFCEKITSVYTKADRNPQRVLFSFTKNIGKTVYEDLIIRDTQGNYTAEYLVMMKDFYLFA